MGGVPNIPWAGLPLGKYAVSAVLHNLAGCYMLHGSIPEFPDLLQNVGHAGQQGFAMFPAALMVDVYSEFRMTNRLAQPTLLVN